jgi:hypothetical protein
VNEDTAKLVISAGAAIGVIVWLVAVQLFRRMAESPVYETLEAPVPGKTPTEAMKAIVANAGQIAAQARLARPEETVMEITQHGVFSRIEARREGGQTLLVAEIDDSACRRRYQRFLALFVVLLMPVTIVGVSAGLWHFAASSVTPSVRTQSVQVCQIVHVLWPPFMLYGVWKTQRRAAHDAVSNLLVIAGA